MSESPYRRTRSIVHVAPPLASAAQVSPSERSIRPRTTVCMDYCSVSYAAGPFVIKHPILNDTFTSLTELNDTTVWRRP
eukprot:scaffold78421_cov63-Phaeocystis_antarctica.AAC.5